MKIEDLIKKDKIGTEAFYKFRLALNKESEKYEVIGNDGFVWSEASTPEGAINGCLASGNRFSDIYFNRYLNYGKINFWFFHFGGMCICG